MLTNIFQSVRPSAERLHQLAVHASRLYEEKEDFARLGCLKGGLTIL
ncbi:hypothetical protein [Propionispira raffinosivorans]|nr:hypothetical protein [Propionispira raffinosivorans]